MAERKIALIVATLAGGGAERVMINLAQALQGWKDTRAVLVVMADSQAAPVHELPAGEFEVVTLQRRRVLRGACALHRLLRSEDWDVVISAQEHVNLLVSWILKLIHKPIIFIPVVHNTLSIKLAQSPKWMDRLLVPLCRWFYPRLRVLGAVSQGVKQDLVDFFRIPSSKIRILPNPVVDEKSLVEAAYGLQTDFAGILAVGRLVPAKGFDVLLRAYALLAEKVDLPLMILGEGSEREKLEILVQELGLKDSVTLPGFIKDPTAVMRSAKLFVLSSREEGLSNVLIEAMASGIPVVATDCPSGPREILEDGKYGVLVPVDDISALAHAMLETLQLPPVSAEELKAKASEYSFEASRTAYLSLIDEMEKGLFDA